MLALSSSESVLSTGLVNYNLDPNDSVSGIAFLETNTLSEPSGTKTPFALRYSRKSSDSGLMMVVLILWFAKAGYHEENWKVSI